MCRQSAHAYHILHMQLHPLNQQKEIVAYCQKHGIFVEAYAPLIRTEWKYPAILDTAKKVRRRCPKAFQIKD